MVKGKKVTKRYTIDSGVSFKRGIRSGTHRFADIFSGFDRVAAVRKVFGSETKAILSELLVEVFPKEGYMGVSDEDGHIFASQIYINEGDKYSIYLDVVHELVHVRQFREGKELFDRSYAYVDRPTEREAYKIAADEARKIGLSEAEVFDYLKVPWISDEEHERLAVACNVPESVLEEFRSSWKNNGKSKNHK